ncbi:HD domain-containing phosphohydrolase [Desulfofundulus thermosubterraneus]|uniref:HDIG domain-containing protein n=1 Tax=Desulfofundulus thermosubterraneus DSM 16057 TaxID=1121432 RepID=A0A1M6FB73_9FIRM|nr:HD domain-containing phosphohydrolase [Desulfofundulus thermosubterraneus]SHI94859.1 HDIG domain-containing protein [Desulfofundulus thermosubterraneus DSM 16057]
MDKEKLVPYYEELKQIGLQELLESMRLALGLAVMATYPDGRPLTEPSTQCAFCTLLNTSPEGRARCADSRASSARIAVAAGREVIHTCHAGLVHLAVPLRVAGEIVAVMLGGNVALRPPAEEAVVRLARETGLDPGKLQAAAGAMPIWPEERLRAAMGLAQAVTGTVARLLHARQELQRKVDELTTLFEFTRTVTSSIQVAEVAQQALEAVLGLTGATSGSVVMLNEVMPGVTESETAATLESCNEFRVVPAGEIVAAVEREARAAHFDSRPEGSTPEEKRPAVAIPLTVGGKVTGVLTIAGRPEGAHFTEDETVFLTTLGTGLGLALENARLFRQLQARATMLERLIEVGQVVSSSLDVDLVLQSALENVRDVLGAQWCALRLLDEETGELVLKAGLGMSAELQARAGRIRPDGTLLGRVLQTGRPAVVEDLAASGPGTHLPYCVAEMRAVAVVPVKVGGRILGTLKVYSPVPRRWSEDEVSYLATIAGQTGLALENARLYSSLREHYSSAVQALAAALEARDVYTKGHSVRVANWARACARVLGLDAGEQERVYLAGLLHDLGKIGVREDILLKPGPLTTEERKEMQSHPEVGARILEPARFPAAVIAAVRHHHEDYDGGGYPAGLVGEEIPLLARIIRVADTYDAMTSARPYRQAFTPRQAREELQRWAGRQFDPRVVEAFLQIPEDEMVVITNGGGGVATLLFLPTGVASFADYEKSREKQRNREQAAAGQ